MFQKMRILGKRYVLGVALAMLMLIGANKAMAMDMESGHEMTSHHQHMMLNHALGMVVEGSNLVMLSEMSMSTEVDAMSAEHGNMMIKNGTTMYNEIMTGKEMLGMHHEGKDPMKDPTMAYTHKLAERELIVMDLLGKMPKMEKGADMTMHHQHITLNHALKMALEGANILMLGEMGMAGGIDEIDKEHGRMMIKNAKALYNDVMSGSQMTKMHTEGTSPESNEAMQYTHKLAEAQLLVITTLEEMPGIK
jgi:hypothetical protein